MTFEKYPRVLYEEIGWFIIDKEYLKPMSSGMPEGGWQVGAIFCTKLVANVHIYKLAAKVYRCSGIACLHYVDTRYVNGVLCFRRPGSNDTQENNTAKRKLERLQFSTSSSFFKI